MSTIEAKTLATWLDTGLTKNGSKLKLLYTTMPGGTATKQALQHDVQNKVIAQSIRFDFQACFADTNSHLSNTMCSNAQFQTQARKLRLNNEDTLVIYDNYGNFCASRVWFMCKAMGFNEVYLLDGGLPKWISLGFPIQSDCIDFSQDNSPEGNFIVSPNNEFRFVDQQYVESLVLQGPIGHKNQCILDARGPDRFTGQIADPRPNVRSGHIPSSLNLHYTEIQDEWGGFLPLEQLQKKFADLSTKNSQYVFSCGSGVTACILAQAAYMLNLSPLLVYDGSWSEWGANEALPIAVG